MKSPHRELHAPAEASPGKFHQLGCELTQPSHTGEDPSPCTGTSRRFNASLEFF